MLHCGFCDQARHVMGVRIFVETVFENGRMLTQDVRHIYRPLKHDDPESLGLHLDQAKDSLKRLRVRARHSFRVAARLMETSLSCAPQLSTTVRNVGRIAAKCFVPAEAASIDTSVDANAFSLTVFLYGAQIRCQLEYQKRHLDIVVGKIENSKMNRRFGFLQQAAKSPLKQL